MSKLEDLKKKLNKDFPEDLLVKIRKEKREYLIGKIFEKSEFILNRISEEFSRNAFKQISEYFDNGVSVKNIPSIQKVKEVKPVKEVIITNYKELAKEYQKGLKEIFPLDVFKNFLNEIKISDFPLTQNIKGDVNIAKVKGGMDIKFPEIQKTSIINWPLIQKIDGSVSVDFPDVQKIIGKVDVNFPGKQKIEGKVKTDIKFCFN